MAYKNWMPSGREKQLAMAKNWLPFVKGKGKRDWGMCDEIIGEFENAITAAESENNRPLSTRNAGTNVLLKNTFDTLTQNMREIKKRFLHTPPVLVQDMANMGLKLRDTTPTAVGAPKRTPVANFTFPSIGLVEINKIGVSGGQAKTREYHGVRIYYGILAQGEDGKDMISKRPQTGDDLAYSIFTRKDKHRFDFSDKRGKEVFFCMRYENGKGQAGPWGKMFNVFIP